MGILCPISDEYVTSIYNLYYSYYLLTGPDVPDTVALPTTQRKKKAAVEFKLDDNDVPILDDPSQLMARDMEPLVRQYMSIHYSESCKGEMNE
jgi:hypothetical protein